MLQRRCNSFTHDKLHSPPCIIHAAHAIASHLSSLASLPSGASREVANGLVTPTMLPLRLSGLPWPSRPLRTLAPSPCLASMLFLSLVMAGATPVAEYMLFRSGTRRELLPCRPGVAGMPPCSMLALRTLRGRLSRLPPHREEGANARTDASVSIERRRRRLLEEAKVNMEALSVRRLFAVAVVYVVGLLLGAKCGGMADAGGAVGKGWLN